MDITTNQPLFQVLHPARVAVERCRSAAWERRRGLPAALDARWADGAQPSPPRGRWQALAPPPGPGVADGVGRRQDAGCLRGQELVQPCGLPQLYTAGWGASARQVAAAHPPWGRRTCPGARASTASCGPGARGSCGARCVLPRPNLCTISSWGCVATALSLADPSKGKSTPVRHLPRRNPPPGW